MCQQPGQRGTCQHWHSSSWDFRWSSEHLPAWPAATGWWRRSSGPKEDPCSKPRVLSVRFGLCVCANVHAHAHTHTSYLYIFIYIYVFIYLVIDLFNYLSIYLFTYIYLYLYLYLYYICVCVAYYYRAWYNIYIYISYIESYRKTGLQFTIIRPQLAYSWP